MRPSAEDRIAIADLHARNAWALDLGDSEAFIATFTADAVLQMRQRYEGHRGIAEFMTAFRERDFGYPRAQHLVTQLLIEDAGGDRVSCRSYVTRVHRLPGQHRGNTHVMWTGYSIDTCVNAQGRWLFQSRTLRAWEGDVSATFDQAALEPAGRRG